MKRVIILHQYNCPEHFLGLYHCEGISVELRNIDPFLYVYKILSAKGAFGRNIRFVFSAFRNLIRMYFIRDTIVIVGFSPFNPLLFLMIPVVRKNNAVFFTSWPGWNRKERAPVGFAFLRNAWENIIKKHFSAVACVNLESLRYWKGFLPSYLMEHSIKTEEYLVKREYAGTNKFIFLGRRSRYKNFDVLINIVSRNPDIFMHIAGDTKFKGETGGGRIKFLGMHDRSWIKRNLREYDALILPSDWQEPFGIVLLEAMAAGLPVIITPTAGTETIFRDNHYRFTADSSRPCDIEKAIGSFLESSPEERRETGERLVNMAERYSPWVMSGRWSELLRDISKRSSRA